jgi:integrase
MPNLTDRTLASLRKKRAKSGKRIEIWDTRRTGFGVRVTDSGHVSFVMVARFGGKGSNPTRRALGTYPAMTLKSAHRKADEWRELIDAGKDPAEVEAARRVSEAQQRANTFARVAEDFIAKKLPEERRGKEVARDIRTYFVSVWGSRPISEITDEDIVDVISAKAATAPSFARNLLGYAKRVFSWASKPTRRKVYGLSLSPCAGIKPTDIDGIGEKKTGDRVLTDAELFALWRVAGRLRFPYGPIYRLLILTGLRLNEVAGARWSEFDLGKREWTVPPERMKGRNARARAHLVPVTDEMIALLATLPRLKGIDFVFPNKSGLKPVTPYSQLKQEIDERILRTLRAMARRDGNDSKAVNLKPWENRDVRRTLRTGLSALRVPDATAEAVIAHAQQGIKRNYNLHDYRDEKLEALTLWASYIRSLGEPKAPNVLQFPARA